MVKSTETLLGNSSPSCLQKTGLHLLFFLRFIQLGSVTITGFIYCYLVWHHNNHYCSYFPSGCTPLQRSYVEVPWEYKLVIAACTLAFLESYASTTYFLHRQRMPNYRGIFFTIVPVTAFFGYAGRAIYNNPAMTQFCHYLNLPWAIQSNVEEKNCVILTDGWVALSIAAGFTVFIFLMSTIVVISQSLRRGIMLHTYSKIEECDVADDKDDEIPSQIVIYHD